MRPGLRVLMACLPMLLACGLTAGERMTAVPVASATAEGVTPPPEAIQITQPGPGSRLISPMNVQVRTVRSTIEHRLMLRVLSDDGRELVPPQAVVASSDEGDRLNFTAALPFSVAEERNAFLQAYWISPRDGGVTHLSSIWLRLMPAGQVIVEPAPADPVEQLQIMRPAAGASVSGGTLHVEGIGLASFEQTLLIEVIDAAGRVIGLQPVLVQAPDWGMAGPFKAEVAYTLDAAGAGRIVVRDISPAHGDDVHRASVEVELAP